MNRKNLLIGATFTIRLSRRHYHLPETDSAVVGVKQMLEGEETKICVII